MKWIILILSCLTVSAQHPLLVGSGIDWSKPPPFNPEQVPNLYAEYYADSSADWLGATGGGSGAGGIGWSNRAVTTWDLTRAATDEGTSPIYSSSGPNSLFCVDFTGNASGSGAHKLWAHNRNGSSAITLSNQPNTIFIVCQDKTTAAGVFLFDTASGVGGRELFALSTVNGVGGMSAGAGITFPPSANTGNYFIYTICFNGTSSYCRTNGVVYNKGDASTAALGQIVLANSQPDNTPYTGKWYALLAYSTATISTNNMISIERYLNTKANLGYTIPGP